MSTSAGKWIALAALAVGMLALAPAAQARPAIEVLSPQRGAVHVAATPKHALKVRVRVATGVRGLRAVVSGRSERVATRRFRRGRGGIWAAKLRLGRELSRGPGAVRLSGRLGRRRVAASAHFWVASRRAEMLRVRGLPRRTAARPLDVRMRTAERVDDVRVRVNGRSVRDMFTRTAGGRWHASLSANAGLRFGRNRIAITAYDRRGTFERVRRVVRVRRGRPLAGAGRDRLVSQRETVRLDGRKTLPHKGARLRLTWRIVRRPDGSRARLRNRHAVRPHLRPDHPGVYRIRLTVRPRRARGTASAAALQSSDTVNVAAQPVTLPEGIRVQTIAVDGQSGPGIKVGDDWYPMDAGGSLQMVVLDGSTLELISNNTVMGDDDGMGELSAFYYDAPTDAIVLLAQPAATPWGRLGQTGSDQLMEVLVGLGIVEDDASNGQWGDGYPDAGWSAVGSPHSEAGRGLLGIEQSPGRPAGAMDGFLQNSASTTGSGPGDTYVFNWPSTFTQFNTRSGGDNSTHNQMTIAGQTFTSATIHAGSSAFHLVWLDGGSLALDGQATIPGDQGQQLAQTLAGISNAGPAVLFMTTIGHPSVPGGLAPNWNPPRVPDGTGDAWVQAAQQIAGFGGNASAFLSLVGDANSEYSLAGASLTGTQTPNAGADVSRNLLVASGFDNVASTAWLVGTLERRPGGAWNVASGDAPGPDVPVATFAPDIKRVLAQPDQPFAAFTDPAQRAAEQYIADQIDIDESLDPTYGIRALYWDPDHAGDWDELSRKIDADVSPCTTDPCSQGFQPVYDQLKSEFDSVATVRNYFTGGSDSVESTVNSAFLESTLGFDAISNAIISEYPPQEPEASGPSPFDVVEGMADMAAELAPEGGEAFAVAGAAIEIAGAFSEGEDSSGYLGATVVEAQAAQLASTLVTGYSDTLNGLERVADLLVSDAGRLQAANTEVLNDWAFDSSTLGGGVSRSLQAYMWGALLPTTFKAYQCVYPPVYYPPVPVSDRPPWGTWYLPNDGYLKTPAALQFKPFASVTQFDPRIAGGWGASDDDPGQQISDGFVTIAGEIAGDLTYIRTGDAGELFGQIRDADPNALGLLPGYFLAPQPAGGGAGFAVDQGAYVDSGTHGAQADGYARYLCADNEWREDTNVGGQ